MSTPLFFCGLYIIAPGRSRDIKSTVPATSLEVEAVVIDQACEVRLSHTFQHSLASAVETEFSFPLIENAAVCSFEAEIKGRRVVGIAKEKFEARSEYEAAKSRGDGAYLLEQDRTDVFTASLGNVPPHTPVTVRTTYVCELGSEGEALRFVLPTTIMPRYDTSAAGTSSYRLKFKATFVMGGEIKSLSSPTHPAFGITQNGKVAVVSGEESLLNRDLVLLAECADAHAPRVMCEASSLPGATSCALQLSLFPRVTLRNARCELFFLVDRSGSMGSDGRMENCVAALELFVRSLPADCLFEIVSFGSSHSALFNMRPQQYTQATLDKAVAHVSGMSADMGGTELYQPLQAIFNVPVTASYSRQVFVLTDGGISAMDRTLDMARSSCRSNGTRIFTLGIGGAVSHALVDGLARAGSGVAEFVSDHEKPQAKVLRQLKLALQPALRNVRVKWGGACLQEARAEAPAPAVGGMLGSLLEYTAPDADLPAAAPRARQAPRAVPTLFSSQPFVVYALYENARDAPKEVSVEADTAEGTLSATIPVTSTPAPGKLLHTLAARKLIRDLEEAPTLDRAELVRLGRTYSLASSATSFIAVEERSLAEKETQRVFVPAPPPQVKHAAMAMSFGCAAPRNRMAHGSAAGGRVAMAAPAPMAAAPPMQKSSVSNREASKKKKEKAEESKKSARVSESRMEMDESEGGEMAADDFAAFEPHASSDLFEALVRCQKFDGSFTLDAALASALEVDLAKLKAALPKGGDASVFAAVCAIAAFRVKFSSRKDEWELIVTKTENWLSGKGDLGQYRSAANTVCK